MSFYFDDDDEYDLYYDDNTSSRQQQPQQQLQQRIKSQANGSQNDGFVCHNCGGTESYEDDSGALICTECYTHSLKQRLRLHKCNLTLTRPKD